MDRRRFLKLCLAGGVASSLTLPMVTTSCRSRFRHPNILIIYADDLGYGDVGVYNPESKIPTPNLDRLAREGIRFTDAHSPSTVCTPSRYGLLTGRMPFRAGVYRVFAGAGGPSVIEPERLTLSRLLRNHGYATACVGKWHLGLTFYNKEGRPINENSLEGVKRIDFSRPISGGPTHFGFDWFFGTACCPTTDWLYAYIEGDRVPVPPTDILNRDSLPKHPFSNDLRPGIIAPNYKLEEVDLVFLEKSQDFLWNHVKKHPEQPFFLYHATSAVHLSSFAADRFKGKTQAGPHGDFIFELDFIVGELLKTLDDLGVADNTLVMFASDNGPETETVYYMRTLYNHDPARPWRGMKRDQWEGGHRIPFIVRWPEKIPSGQTTRQLTSLTDVMATLAAVVDAELPENAAEDSYNMLPVLTGDQEEGNSVRPYLIQQSSQKGCLSLRRGPWKYLNHSGSGGNQYDRSEILKGYIIPDEAPDAPGQLYNLDQDPGETKNLYYKEPEIVVELKEKLEAFVACGRSAPTKRR